MIARRSARPSGPCRTAMQLRRAPQCPGYRCHRRCTPVFACADRVQTPGHVLAWIAMSMRICLYGNPTAGGGTSMDDLTAMIAKAGHQVLSVVEDARDVCPLLDSNVDSIV